MPLIVEFIREIWQEMEAEKRKRERCALKMYDWTPDYTVSVFEGVWTENSSVTVCVARVFRPIKLKTVQFEQQVQEIKGSSDSVV